MNVQVNHVSLGHTRREANLPGACRLTVGIVVIQSDRNIGNNSLDHLILEVTGIEEVTVPTQFNDVVGSRLGRWSRHNFANGNLGIQRSIVGADEGEATDDYSIEILDVDCVAIDEGTGEDYIGRVSGSHAAVRVELDYDCVIGTK